MPQLITIGETMAAFTPDSVGALRYVQNFGIRTAGAESNVAVGLAKLGLEAAWVSRLGTDEFGCFIRNQLRAEGVDCSRVIYDPDHRTGIMFKETGVGETKVFYYRENSAASHLCPEDVTHALLDGVKVLPFAQGLALTAEVGRVLNSKKVSDHHAIITLGLYFAFLARSFSLIYSFSVLLSELSAVLRTGGKRDGRWHDF